jgi:hypothetical protein
MEFYLFSQQTVITVDDLVVNRVVISNSHARRRQEMVTFRVSTFSIKVGSPLAASGHLQIANLWYRTYQG